MEILTDGKFLEAVRYLSGPPISEDDLRVVANVSSLAAQPLRANPAVAKRLVETVMLGLDRQRFPWIYDKRDPSRREKAAAVLASAVLVASQRVATSRRSEGKTQQENRDLLGARSEAGRTMDCCDESWTSTAKSPRRKPGSVGI